MHVCTYVFYIAAVCMVIMYICMHSCMHVFMFASIYLSLYVSIYVCMYVCMFACMNVHSKKSGNTDFSTAKNCKLSYFQQ